ncbi:MAG: hypothetical protein MR536_00780 [Prevotella sp.]|nr:hypothetical protein [Prevotella sp.]MDD7462641.1 hypothetical protein [Prevotellaceae bacterium]MDY3365909.1 hypothetical protein [Prevotella sp.]MDY3851937.1 hypothetical protein [Prevotella sp.]
MLNNKRERRMLQGLNDDDRFFKIRNILNIIFILGAVIGVLLYVYSSQTVGTIIILISMVFKIIECILRFIR